MTGATFSARLAAAGLSPDEAEGKRRLGDGAALAFDRFAGGGAPPAWWWIPGRLEVFGKHTDYCGGHSLVGTVPRGFVLLARGRADGIVRMLDARRQEQLTLTVGAVRRGEAPPHAGWRNYAQTVIRRLARNFPGAPLGADLVFASDLPPASGMSSSSALMVGLAAALGDPAGLAARREWRDSIHGAAGQAGYYACIENGLSFGGLRGDHGVGTHGGSEDHLAIVCGAAGHLALWSFVPITALGDVAVPDGWTIAIASSGVRADKTGSAKEAYNRLSREAAALLELWNAREAPQPSLSAALRSHASAPDRLQGLVEADRGAHRPALTRRLRHFLRENGRAAAALEAFRLCDRDAIGSLAAASQQDAESLLHNQVPETIALARAARDLGAFASSGFGAGFGGSVWALVEADAAPAFADRWLADHRARFPGRTAATVFLAPPGPGLTRVA